MCVSVWFLVLFMIIVQFPVQDEFKKPSEISTLSAHSEDTIADEDTDDEFVRVSPPLMDETNLYLFARTDREKEIW